MPLSSCFQVPACSYSPYLPVYHSFCLNFSLSTPVSIPQSLLPLSVCLPQCLSFSPYFPCLPVCHRVCLSVLVFPSFSLSVSPVSSPRSTAAAELSITGTCQHHTAPHCRTTSRTDLSPAPAPPATHRKRPLPEPPPPTADRSLARLPRLMAESCGAITPVCSSPAALWSGLLPRSVVLTTPRLHSALPSPEVLTSPWRSYPASVPVSSKTVARDPGLIWPFPPLPEPMLPFFIAEASAMRFGAATATFFPLNCGHG